MPQCEKYWGSRFPQILYRLIGNSPIPPCPRQCTEKAPSGNYREPDLPWYIGSLLGSHRARELAISATLRAAPGVPSLLRTSARPSSTRLRSGSDGSSSLSSSTLTFAGDRSFCTNSRATSLPATTLTNPMCGIVTCLLYTS